LEPTLPFSRRNMGCAWQLVLLSSLCLLVKHDAIRVADSDDIAISELKGGQEVGQPLVPFSQWGRSPWNMTNSWDRCQAARRGRNVRRIAGAVVGVAIALPVALIGALTYGALYTTWYVGGSNSMVLFVAKGSAYVGGVWATLMAGKKGSQLTHWSSDMIAYLFGKDGHKPVCCCVENDDDSAEKLCGTVGSKIGSRAECPEGFLHDPQQCETREPALTYGGEFGTSPATHGGCTCENATTCEENNYHRGHAWCKVETSKGCNAKRFKLNPFKHWDYCRVVAADVPNTELKVNTFVSQFTINEDKAWYRGKATNVWRFGSYVDVSKALVIVKVKVIGKKSSQCFPGVPEETLDGCAQKCLEDEAPISTKNGEDLSIPCVAFAYNRHTRLCVRLPSAATGAEFRPWQRNPAKLKPGDSADGWQNFKLMDAGSGR